MASKQEKVKIVPFPPLTKGIDTVHHTVNIPAGYAQQLQNCQYRSGVLSFGRGGLKKLNSSALDGNIVDFIEIDGTMFAATSTKKLYSLNMTTWTATLLSTNLYSGTALLLNFNNDLIICDGGRTKRYDGTHIFVIGSHADTITDNTSDGSDKLYSTKTYTYTTDADGFYHKILRVSLYLKRVGIPQDVTVTLTYGGTDYSTETILGTEITETYGVYDFDLGMPLEVGSGAAVTVTVTATDTDTDNYIVIGKYSGAPMWRFNGQYAPKAATGTIWDGHLILTRDTDNASRCYFSNVNLADDYWTEAQAGYISFDDSTHSSCTACTIVFNRLALTGTSASKPMTTFVDSSWAVSHRFVGEAKSKRAFQGSFNTLYMVGDNGLAITQGSDAFGDIQFASVSKQIQDRFDDSILGDVIIEYMPSTKQIFVKLTVSESLYVFHPDGGQWTTYKFAVSGMVPTSFHEYSTVIYVGSDDGYLYELDSALMTDDSATIDYQIISNMVILSPFSNVSIQEFNLSLVTDSSSSVACTLTLIGNKYDVAYTLSKSAADDDVYDTTMDVAAATTTHSNKITSPFVKKCRVVTDTLQYKLSGVTINETPLAVGQLVLKLIGDGRNIEG